MIDRLFELHLLLNLTGIVPYFAAGHVGPASAFLNPVSLSINLLYLVHHWPATRRALQRRSPFEWTLFLAIWPALALALLALGGEAGGALREIGVGATLASLVLGSAVYVHLRGWARMRTVAWCAVGITAFGIVLNWSVPSIFQYTSYFQNETVEFKGLTRAFFGNASSAASAIIAFAVILCTGRREATIGRKAAVVAAMLVLVAATGSRGGMVLAAVMTTILAWQSRSYFLVGGRRVSTGVAGSAIASFLGIAAICAFFALSWIGGRLLDGDYDVLGWRLQFWTQVRSAEDLVSDQSLSARLQAQQSYLGEIGERPLLGYGASENREKVALGVFNRTSHNMYLSLAFNYGVLYALFFIYLLIRLFRTGSLERLSPSIRRAALNTAVLLTLASLLSATVLLNRPLLIALGAVIGSIAFATSSSSSHDRVHAAVARARSLSSM